MARKNKDATLKYQRDRYKDIVTKAKNVDEIIQQVKAMGTTPHHCPKYMAIGLVMALAMSSVSLWYSWRVFDALQGILGR